MQSSKKLHNKTKIAISFAIITCITLILFWFYNIHLQRVLENNICKTLDEITQQQKFSLNQTIEAHINKLENLAEIVVILDSDEQSILSSFNKLKANTNFDHIILSDTKGNGVSTDGERASIRDRAYFINSLAGENVISMPVISKTQGYAILPLSVPIHNNQGELMGVLMGGYNMEELNSFISPSFDGEGYAKIISSDGTIISMPEGSDAPLMVASSTDNNVFTGLESAQFIAYDTRADIIRKISEGKSGNSEYKMDNQTQFFSYSPLGINDWYIISIVTSDAIAADAHDILNKAILLTASVMAMLILVFFYIYLQQKKAEQMQKE
ncbi:MAG: cache domain-containing protein, partial [Anaerotignaceae bacterium]